MYVATRLKVRDGTVFTVDGVSSHLSCPENRFRKTVLRSQGGIPSSSLYLCVVFVLVENWKQQIPTFTDGVKANRHFAPPHKWGLRLWRCLSCLSPCGYRDLLSASCEMIVLVLVSPFCFALAMIWAEFLARGLCVLKCSSLPLGCLCCFVVGDKSFGTPRRTDWSCRNRLCCPLPLNSSRTSDPENINGDLCLPCVHWQAVLSKKKTLLGLFWNDSSRHLCSH